MPRVYLLWYVARCSAEVGRQARRQRNSGGQEAASWFLFSLLHGLGPAVSLNAIVSFPESLLASTSSRGQAVFVRHSRQRAAARIGVVSVAFVRGEGFCTRREYIWMRDGLNCVVGQMVRIGKQTEKGYPIHIDQIELSSLLVSDRVMDTAICSAETWKLAAARVSGVSINLVRTGRLQNAGNKQRATGPHS